MSFYIARIITSKRTFSVEKMFFQQICKSADIRLRLSSVLPPVSQSKHTLWC